MTSRNSNLVSIHVLFNTSELSYKEHYFWQYCTVQGLCEKASVAYGLLKVRTPAGSEASVIVGLTWLPGEQLDGH